MSKRVIYIAGPISGKVAYNFPEFDRAARMLTEQGWYVQNPAEIAERFCADYGTTLEDIEQNTNGALDRLIGWEMNVLQDCDAIYLLNGWENSVGACRELVAAIKNDLIIILESKSATSAESAGETTTAQAPAKSYAERWSTMPDGSRIVRMTDEQTIRHFAKWREDDNKGNYYARMFKHERKAFVEYNGRTVIEMSGAGSEFMEMMMRDAIRNHISMRLGKKRRLKAKKIRLREAKIAALNREIAELTDINAKAKEGK